MPKNHRRRTIKKRHPYIQRGGADEDLRSFIDTALGAIFPDDRWTLQHFADKRVGILLSLHMSIDDLFKRVFDFTLFNQTKTPYSETAAHFLINYAWADKEFFEEGRFIPEALFYLAEKYQENDQENTENRERQAIILEGFRDLYSQEWLKSATADKLTFPIGYLYNFMDKFYFNTPIEILEPLLSMPWVVADTVNIQYQDQDTGNTLLHRVAGNHYTGLTYSTLELILSQSWATHKVLQTATTNKLGRTALSIAVEMTRDAKIVNLLLTQPWSSAETLNLGAVDKEGQTAFSQACMNNPEIPRLFLEQDYVTIEDLRMDAVNKYGFTAFSHLVSNAIGPDPPVPGLPPRDPKWLGVIKKLLTYPDLTMDKLGLSPTMAERLVETFGDEVSRIRELTDGNQQRLPKAQLESMRACVTRYTSTDDYRLLNNVLRKGTVFSNESMMKLWAGLKNTYEIHGEYTEGLVPVFRITSYEYKKHELINQFISTSHPIEPVPNLLEEFLGISQLIILLPGIQYLPICELKEASQFANEFEYLIEPDVVVRDIVHLNSAQKERLMGITNKIDRVLVLGKASPRELRHFDRTKKHVSPDGIAPPNFSGFYAIRDIARADAPPLSYSVDGDKVTDYTIQQYSRFPGYSRDAAAAGGGAAQVGGERVLLGTGGMGGVVQHPKFEATIGADGYDFMERRTQNVTAQKNDNPEKYVGKLFRSRTEQDAEIDFLKEGMRLVIERSETLGIPERILKQFFILPLRTEPVGADSIPADLRGGLTDGFQQIVMERGDPVEADATFMAYRNLIEGVILLDRMGVVHGDITRGNILNQEGVPKLIDWSFVADRREWGEDGTKRKRFDARQIGDILNFAGLGGSPSIYTVANHWRKLAIPIRGRVFDPIPLKKRGGKRRLSQRRRAGQRSRRITMRRMRGGVRLEEGPTTFEELYADFI